jgi:D-ribose pyranase
MKKHGILNAQLAGYIAALGHKDLFMVGDAGMPIPAGVPIVDLVVTAGVPTFVQVLDAILDETVVEGYTLATEIKEHNPKAAGVYPGQAAHSGSNVYLPYGFKENVSPV